MFLEEIESVAKIIKPMFKEKSVRLVSHFDADGISSAAIMAKALMREGVNFELRVVKQLTAEDIQELEKDVPGKIFIFVDLGSGQIEGLKSIIDQTQVIVLDHHEPVRNEHPNLLHINPLLFAEDEVSGSMVCYLFAKALNIANTDLIELAIVGAVGDVQDEKWEFTGLARRLLEEAETLGKVSVMKGLRLYGRNTRPVFKALEYSFDPIIPGISGSESQAVQFLSDLNIPIKQHEQWRKLKDLTEAEQKRLASAIIMERLKFEHEDAADVFGDVYTLVGKPEELQDAREFATLINACSRTGNVDIALALCLEVPSSLSRSYKVIEDYRKKIASGMDYLRNGSLQQHENIAYIVAGRRIPDTMIGTITSVALKSNLVSSDVVVGMAEVPESAYVKVSARAKDINDLNLNLRDIIVKAADTVDGEGGGHKFAAGALISKGRETEFIKAMDGLIALELRNQASQSKNKGKSNGKKENRKESKSKG